MKKNEHSFLMGILILFGASIIACSTDNDTPEPEPNPQLTNTEKAIAILEAIESGDVAAMQNYLEQTAYIQHNLAYPDGAGAIIGATQSGAFAGTTIDTKRSFADGDYVVLHSEYGCTWNNDTAQVVFDVFRFENGLIVEHWDNLANIQDDGDGTTQLNWPITPATKLDKTEANRNVITETSQKKYLLKDFTAPLATILTQSNTHNTVLGLEQIFNHCSGFYLSYRKGHLFINPLNLSM